MINQIKTVIEKISLSNKPIKVISHFDTDGITSAAIFSRVLERWGKSFSLQIIKSLDEKFIDSLPETHLLIFLDLASNSLSQLAKKNTEVLILDHHEVSQDIPDNVTIINPHLQKHELISSAGICYIFGKTLSPKNTDLANLAIIGIVGDLLEKNISPSFAKIIKEADATIKKGLLIYPSTRPINRVLEYSSSPYIPGVSGSPSGTLELLREASITPENGKYKALYELSQDEMEKLITAVMLRFVPSPKKDISDLIGNLYLIKFFNKLEDARELSASINACSRMGHPEIALSFCLGNSKSRELAEKIYIEYRQNIVSALKHVTSTDKITGKNYTIINAKDNIKDTIIGTIASIISYSPAYEKGTIIIALAYNEDKIKVSARLAGREGRNVREVLAKAVLPLGGEVGGHHNAAGCLIEKEQESVFISELKKTLDIELVNV